MKNKKIKIFYVITQAEFGGAQKYVYMLSKYMDKNKYDVKVICGDKGGLIEKLRNDDIDVLVLPEMKRQISPYNDFKALIKLYKLFKMDKPEIVHTNSSKAGLLGRISAKMAGVPVIIFTAHGFVFNEPMPVLKKSFYLLAEYFSGLFTDMIISVSRMDLNSALKKKIISKNKIKVVYHGLENEEIKKIQSSNKTKNSIGLSNENIVVGTIAHFYKTKGLEYLVNAAEFIVKEVKNVKFVIIGDGILEKEIKSLIISKDLNENVLMLGYRQDAVEIMKIFDIFVMSSIKEGFPFILLEAMAAGKAIVATKVGGIPEMIEDRKEGILVNSGDVKALSEAILGLINNKTLADTLAKNAREKIEKRFLSQDMINNTEKLYNELILKKCGGSYAA